MVVAILCKFVELMMRLVVEITFAIIHKMVHRRFIQSRKFLAFILWKERDKTIKRMFVDW